MIKKIFLLVLAVVISITGLIVLGEAYLNDKGLTPIIGSRISTIEVYGGNPADRIGPVLSIGNKKDARFKYIASSGIFKINSFDKKSYESKHPENFCYIEKNSREGIEVVHIYTNDPKVDIAEFCH